MRGSMVPWTYFTYFSRFNANVENHAGSVRDVAALSLTDDVKRAERTS